MASIKIVQIAYVGEDYATEYLDNKGRVWIREYVKEHKSPEFDVPVRGYYQWSQYELPDEPEAKAGNPKRRWWRL